MATKEWRVEVLWRMDADTLDNDTIEAVADAADDREWTVSRWEYGAGMYIVGYVNALTVAEAADTVYAQVGKFMDTQGVPGHRATVEALPLDIAEWRADQPTVPELVSAADAAEILHVSRQRIHQLATSNPQFPAPVARVASGPLWTANAIRHFAEVWERRTGRPPLRAVTR